jgi:hypothetical protein
VPRARSARLIAGGYVESLITKFAEPLGETALNASDGIPI